MIHTVLKWTDDVINNGVVVIVDTLRATSTIPVALYSGAKKVDIVRDGETAKRMKKENADCIIAGERGGIPLEGFECGNSPFYLSGTSKGKDVVLTTSNLSLVMDKVAGAGMPVIAASVVNAKAVAEYIAEKGYDHILFLATGTYRMHGQRYERAIRTEEDSIAALYIAYELSKLKKMNEDIFEHVKDILENEDELVNFLWNAEYSKYLLELNKKTKDGIHKKDMEVCFGVNTHPCVPVMKRENGISTFVIE
jgi:2-phosphosulfolactate phosphatase